MGSPLKFSFFQGEYLPTRRPTKGSTRVITRKQFEDSACEYTLSRHCACRVMSGLSLCTSVLLKLRWSAQRPRFLGSSRPPPPPTPPRPRHHAPSSADLVRNLHRGAFARLIRVFELPEFQAQRFPCQGPCVGESIFLPFRIYLRPSFRDPSYPALIRSGTRFKTKSVIVGSSNPDLYSGKKSRACTCWRRFKISEASDIYMCKFKTYTYVIIDEIFSLSRE